MNPLGAELLLQFGPPLGNGLSISPLECGANFDPPLATPKFDPQLGTRIGPKDGRHRCGTQPLQQNYLTGKLIREAGNRPCLRKRKHLDGLRKLIQLADRRSEGRHSHRGIGIPRNG
jgi:hypothetical protein